MGLVSGKLPLIFAATFGTSFSLYTWTDMSVASPSGKPKNSMRSSFDKITRSLVRMSDSDTKMPTISKVTPILRLSMSTSSSPISSCRALATPEPMAQEATSDGNPPSSMERLGEPPPSSPMRV